MARLGKSLQAEISIFPILMGVLRLLFASLIKASMMLSLKMNTEAIRAMAMNSSVPRKYKIALRMVFKMLLRLIR